MKSFLRWTSRRCPHCLVQLIAAADTAKEKPIEATVVAVGNGKVLEDGSVRKLDVKVGNVVLIGKYAGSEVKLDGEEHVIIREDEILCVIEK